MSGNPKIDELKDGLFQVSMLLYKEYVRYVDAGNARIYVINDMYDNMAKFETKEIDGQSADALGIMAIKARFNSMQDDYIKTQDSDMKYRLSEKMNTLSEAVTILEELSKKDV